MSRRNPIALSAALFLVVSVTCAAFAETWQRFESGEDLSGSADILPSTDGQRGTSGFSFAVEFSAPGDYEGTVVRKPGAFALDVSGPPENRCYTFRMVGTNVYVATLKENVLKANGESDPSGADRVAGVLMYCHEPEQSNVGYRMLLYLNGELIGSSPCTSFIPEARVRRPVQLEPSANVRCICLGDFACAPDRLFPDSDRSNRSAGNWYDADARAWRAARTDLRFVMTSNLAVAVKAGKVCGNPIVGAWNLKTGRRLFSADGLAWAVEYEGDDGEVRRLRSASRLLVSTVEHHEGNFVVVSRGKGFVVRHFVRVEGDRLESRLEAEDTVGDRIRGAVFPRVTLLKLPGRDALVEPQFSGVLSPDPTRSHLMDGWMFPGGMVTMQFVGYYNDAEEGLYVGAEDPLAVTKNYTATGNGGRLTVEFFQNAPRAKSGNGVRRFSPCGKGALELFRGGWYEAGRVYRRFLEASAPWYLKDIPRADTPAWFRRTPLWIMGLNLKSERLPAFRYLADYFEFPPSFVCAAIRSPDGIGFYGPNYVLLETARDCFPQLQKEGMHFVGYTNPRLWYAGPDAEKSNGYSQRGKPWSVKDEQGNLRVEHFDDNYVVPCPGVAPWRSHLCARTKMLAQNGLDGVYHDQLPCAVPCLCYDASHGHAAGDPSVWLSGGWWKFCDYLMGGLRRDFPELVHTGEDASEPFAGKLDGFVAWRYGRTGHVPLFQSLYSPRMQFVGRGCDMHGMPGTYESFFPKYAEQLCFGEQIGWVGHQTIAYPSPRRGFLKKLAHCRADLCDFLNAAEMEAPLRFVRPIETMTTRWGVGAPNVVTTDKVLSSCWRHKDGRRLVMFLNTVNEPQRVEPEWKAEGGPFTICNEKSDSPEVQRTAPHHVALDPYAFEFWFVGDAAAAEAPALSRHLSRAASFVRKDRGALLSKAPEFSRTADIDAKNGKFVAPRDVAWGLLAYRPDESHFDYSARLPETKDGWMFVMDGGVAYYGKVDFGEGAKEMELNLATDEPGVSVEFFDLSDGASMRMIAAFHPAAGEWHGYHVLNSPMLEEVSGVRSVICRVRGGICNLKNWRLLTTGGGEKTQSAAKPRPASPTFAKAVKFDGLAGVKAADAAWTLFARTTEKGVGLMNGGYAYFGAVDFGKAPKRISFDVVNAQPNARIELVDVSEFAPSTPLVSVNAIRGEVVADLSFAVKDFRNVVLMVKGGACAIRGWRVLP